MAGVERRGSGVEVRACVRACVRASLRPGVCGEIFISHLRGARFCVSSSGLPVFKGPYRLTVSSETPYLTDQHASCGQSRRDHLMSRNISLSHSPPSIGQSSSQLINCPLSVHAPATLLLPGFFL